MNPAARPLVDRGVDSLWRRLFSRWEFIHGVLATVVGFVLGVVWGEWKDDRAERAKQRQARRLVLDEIETNLMLLDEIKNHLVEDIEAAKRDREMLPALPLLPTDAWKTTQLAGGFSTPSSGLAREIGLTYHRLAVVNQHIQAREMFKATNKALTNYSAYRAAMNRFLVAHISEIVAELKRHRDALKDARS